MQFIDVTQFFDLLGITALNTFLLKSFGSYLATSRILGKLFTYGGKTNSALGGELVVIPTFELLVGRFVARNNFSNVGDTCIITDYSPNLENPGKGGTFKLRGF